MLEDFIIDVEKPGRYLGGEINSVKPCSKLKSSSSKMTDLSMVQSSQPLQTLQSLVRFCIAFPDTYEVGMSHLGIQLLYQILNSREDCFAERCFMPYPDLEIKLRQTAEQQKRETMDIPGAELLSNLGPKYLWSLESKAALCHFDIIGFSLQYELCGTNILTMLDLGGVPLYSKDRTSLDPLVIGGGPTSFQPEPLAPFFDAFLLGDGEEAVHEIVQVVKTWKAETQQHGREDNGNNSRLQLLEALHLIEGVYVPQFYQPTYDMELRLCGITGPADRPIVRKRILSDLSTQPQLSKPIVPLLDVVQDRLGLEVMRGCVRGCRFCQAGYVYRPQRERSPEELLANIKVALDNTGLEQVTLLSLSTADYCSIIPLLKMIAHDYATEELEVSFPSTRVDALTLELLEQVPAKQRQRFTLAPEGGSQRLRDVINKGLSDDQILETINNVFTLGWQGVKLYFMIGLPTETDEDLEAIVALAKRMKSLPACRGKDIMVNASTFVPKPHTPFQWAEQINPDETVRRQRYLSDRLRPMRVGFRFHDPFSSLLEGVFTRGGRELAALWHRAYRNGCRLDGWPEYLNKRAWEKSFEEENIQPLALLQKRVPGDPLPWQHLSTGVSNEFFMREYSRSLNERITHSCLDGRCSLCDVCDDSKDELLAIDSSVHNIFRGATLDPQNIHLLERRSASTKREMRVRFAYSKTGMMRVIGHFETSRAVVRAMRRLALPLLRSQGFSPKPKVSFGPPLQLGVSSQAEYVDAIFTSDVLSDYRYTGESCEPLSLVDSINLMLPEDLRIISAEQIPLNSGSIQDSIEAYGYRVTFREARQMLADSGLLGRALCIQSGSGDTELSLATNFLADALKTCEIKAKRKAGDNRERILLLGDFVYNLCLSNVLAGVSPNSLELTFDSRCPPGRKSPRPLDIVQAISGKGLSQCDIVKTATYFIEDLQRE